MRVTKFRRKLITTVIHILFFSLCIFKAVAQSTIQNSDPELLTQSEFEMSKDGAEAGLEGTIKVALEIDKRGSVEKAKVAGGPGWPCGSSPKEAISRVRKMAEKTALTAKFVPAYSNGSPIKSRGVITFIIGKSSKRAVDESAAAELAKENKMGGIVLKQGIVNGKAIKLPKPIFIDVPGLNESDVTVNVIIAQDGTVESADASYGHELLRGLARDAACKAQFTPTVIQGVPVIVTGKITYHFIRK